MSFDVVCIARAECVLCTQIYEVVYTTVVVSVVCLPVLLSSTLTISVKYAVGGLAVFVVVTTTLTLCFVPKVCRWRHHLVL